jgi:hypothetical protein
VGRSCWGCCVGIENDDVWRKLLCEATSDFASALLTTEEDCKLLCGNLARTSFLIVKKRNCFVSVYTNKIRFLIVFLFFFRKRFSFSIGLFDGKSLFKSHMDINGS